MSERIDINITQAWLEKRYDTEKQDYTAHSPIFGVRGKSERGKIARYIRANRVIRSLVRLGVTKQSRIIDVGCADGHFSNLAHQQIGCDIVCVDISEQACQRVRERYGLTALAANICHLPFPDKAFDVAVCMETLEHIPDPHQAIAELLRVSYATIITVPNEFLRTVLRGHIGIIPHSHLWKFDRTSFDFLRTMGYAVAVYRHTAWIGLLFYMAIEKFGLLTERVAAAAVLVDYPLSVLPLSHGWLFVITETEKNESSE